MGKAWKAEERRIAKALGGERTPLSGSNSKHTSGDVIRCPFYVEAKLSARTNALGERFHRLSRDTIQQVREGIDIEGQQKALATGFATIRWKRCSDRYAILPYEEYLKLAPSRLLETESVETVEHLAQGSQSTRLYQQKLRRLEHLFLSEPAPTPTVCHLYWQGQEPAHRPDAVVITWESLLWLVGRLEICPAGCSWASIAESPQSPACTECAASMEAL